MRVNKKYVSFLALFIMLVLSFSFGIGTIMKNYFINKEENIEPEYFGDSFYFKQLNNTQKSIYKQIEKSTKEFITEVDLKPIYNKINKDNTLIKTKIKNEDVEKAMTVFVLENPEVFFLSKDYKLIKDTYNNNEKIILKYNLSSNQYNYMKKEIDNKIDNIIKNTKNLNDYQKTLYLYEYLVATNNYKKNGPFINTIYGAIVMNKANCEGFSSAFTYIGRIIGLDTWQTIGKLKITNNIKENHSWNIVKLNDSYYHIDTTQENTFYNKNGFISYKFFNTTYDEMIKNIDNQIQFDLLGRFPTHSSYDYSYFNVNDLMINFNNNKELNDKLQKELVKLNKNNKNFIILKNNKHKINKNTFENDIYEQIRNVCEQNNLNINNYNINYDEQFHLLLITNIE